MARIEMESSEGFDNSIKIAPKVREVSPLNISTTKEKLSPVINLSPDKHLPMNLNPELGDHPIILESNKTSEPKPDWEVMTAEQAKENGLEVTVEKGKSAYSAPDADKDKLDKGAYKVRNIEIDGVKYRFYGEDKDVDGKTKFDVKYRIANIEGGAAQRFIELPPNLNDDQLRAAVEERISQAERFDAIGRHFVSGFNSHTIEQFKDEVAAYRSPNVNHETLIALENKIEARGMASAAAYLLTKQDGEHFLEVTSTYLDNEHLALLWNDDCGDPGSKKVQEYIQEMDTFEGVYWREKPIGIIESEAGSVLPEDPTRKLRLKYAPDSQHEKIWADIEGAHDRHQMEARRSSLAISENIGKLTLMGTMYTGPADTNPNYNKNLPEHPVHNPKLGRLIDFQIMDECDNERLDIPSASQITYEDPRTGQRLKKATVIPATTLSTEEERSRHLKDLRWWRNAKFWRKWEKRRMTKMMFKKEGLLASMREAGQDAADMGLRAGIQTAQRKGYGLTEVDYFRLSGDDPTLGSGVKAVYTVEDAAKSQQNYKAKGLIFAAETGERSLPFQYGCKTLSEFMEFASRPPVSDIQLWPVVGFWYGITVKSGLDFNSAITNPEGGLLNFPVIYNSKMDLNDPGVLGDITKPYVKAASAYAAFHKRGASAPDELYFLAPRLAAHIFAYFNQGFGGLNGSPDRKVEFSEVPSLPYGLMYEFFNDPIMKVISDANYIGEMKRLAGLPGWYGVWRGWSGFSQSAGGYTQRIGTRYGRAIAEDLGE